MSESETRKSMDDVLASIRRIVRSEKEPEEAIQQPEEDAAAAMAAPEPAPEPEPVATPEPLAGTAADSAEAPLALTPEMRMDQDGEDDGAVANETMEAPVTQDPEPSVAEPLAPNSDGKLRAMVREVLREEMASEEVSDFVRSVIRDELVNGEIGSNISQNVMALIQSEVSKALGR